MFLFADAGTTPLRKQTLATKRFDKLTIGIFKLILHNCSIN